ncbi:ciliary microtubule inner protein 2C-like [Neodiprion pinetum]|uniref:Ciliary microtubule inner protein 2C n=1 Tax=Neodiprion lecontei TaxID=441921 RepID=A0A6J0BWI8_NEOLC|nr:protein FAM166C-like [Neodiprion lecontei]XP_046410619.1 protein FAM166C-like [Neodiprion fabricii]XP_046469621.1 protein FAM166C-like [Neodiprion pinetum]XP_046603055.1 protein FAM166C-like [Neodiprion virginianus]
MVMGNRNLSENQATFYPPSLNPAYMGAHPPIKVGGSSYEGGTVSYFQSYRNETLSRFSMPPYEWGLQSTPYSPRPDLVAAAKVRDYNRSLSVPRNNITTIDAGRMREIDDLYKGVQMHRQQYKDHTGSLHPLSFFKADEYPFQCSPTLVPTYFSKHPETYTEYKRPPVLPLTFERATKTPYMPEFAFPGIYSPGNCIAYKR